MGKVIAFAPAHVKFKLVLVAERLVKPVVRSVHSLSCPELVSFLSFTLRLASLRTLIEFSKLKS